MLSSMEVTSTDVCVGAWERRSSGDCQRLLGWLYEEGKGNFRALKSAGRSRFAAVRTKQYVEGMTTAVFRQSKICVVWERNSLGLVVMQKEMQLPWQDTFIFCFCYGLLFCLS